MPKAVINTQAMMCANAAMMMQVRPRNPNGPVATYLDWMPWNHTMGGNALFNPVLTEGGTLYIDDGRPMPGMFDETIRNLREISPTYYANVPAGYAALAAAMEKDDALCRSFFKNLGLMAYGGARLPDDLYDRMQALAVRATGDAHRVLYRMGLDRDRADLDRNLLGHRARRPDWAAVSRRRTEDGAVRIEIRTQAARGQRHARLFRPARPHQGGVRRGGLLLHRRRRRVRRSGRPGGRHHLRRPRRRRLQAHDRHLRPCRLVAHRRDRRRDAGDPGCAGDRPGSARSSGCWPGPICMPAGR